MSNFFDIIKQEKKKQVFAIIDNVQNVVSSFEVKDAIHMANEIIRKRNKDLVCRLNKSVFEVDEAMPFVLNTLLMDGIMCFVIGGMSINEYQHYKNLINTCFRQVPKIAIVLTEFFNEDLRNELEAIEFNEVLFVRNRVVFIEKLAYSISKILVEGERIPVMPLAPSKGLEFDSDVFCTSAFVAPNVKFDSDEFCYTAAPMRPNVEFDSDEFGATTVLMGPNVEFDSDEFAYTTALPLEKDSTNIDVSQVNFSAIAPKQIVKGEYAMIDMIVYEDMYRNVVDKIIESADNEMKEIIASAQEVGRDTNIRIRLSSPDIELDDCEETQRWKGRYLVFNFVVDVPSDYSKKQILFIATVYFNDLIATRLKFVASCTSLREQKMQLTREDILTAFISYASQDRSRVATIIQGMKKARPEMDIFFDVESLRCGEDWEKALRSEIERRDILFLCWSNYAKASEWVNKEWHYALENKGIESIEPIPLVSPVVCPPPEELKSKHFNDRSLLYQEI